MLVSVVGALLLFQAVGLPPPKESPQTPPSGSGATRKPGDAPSRKDSNPAGEPRVPTQEDEKQPKKGAAPAAGSFKKLKKDEKSVKVQRTDGKSPKGRDERAGIGGGSATSPTVVEIDLKPQIVEDPARPNGEKVVLTAEVGAADFDDPEEGSTSIEELSTTGQPFSQQTNIQYGVTGGAFTCEVPIVRDPTRDVPYSFVLRIEASKSKAIYMLRAKGVIPQSQPHEEKLGLTRMILLGSAAAVLIAALVILIIWNVRNRNRPPEVVYVPSAPPIQQQQPIHPVQPDFYRTLKDNSQRIGALEQSQNSLLGRPTDDWRRAVGDIGDLQAISAVVQPRSARRGGRPFWGARSKPSWLW